MPDSAEAVDLRDEPERLITLAALCEVRELGPGEARRLLTRDALLEQVRAALLDQA